MKKLWAPWRMEYIENVDNNDNECIFCNDNDLTIIREDFFVIIMNKFPYNNGHIMVAPTAHNRIMEELNEEELTGLFKGVQMGIKIIKKVYNPNGINIGINEGRVAGAGITDHMHVHIVPRWNGDTNFMPVFSDTKIISESLEKSRKKLFEAYKEIKNGK